MERDSISALTAPGSCSVCSTSSVEPEVSAPRSRAHHPGWWQQMVLSLGCWFLFLWATAPYSPRRLGLPWLQPVGLLIQAHCPLLVKELGLQRLMWRRGALLCWFVETVFSGEGCPTLGPLPGSCPPPRSWEHRRTPFL